MDNVRFNGPVKPPEVFTVPDMYYDRIGTYHDFIYRCDSCGKLVVDAAYRDNRGCTHCGSRRVKEVRGLTLWEYIKVRTGILDFPHRDLFLAEFGIGPWLRSIANAAKRRFRRG